MKIKRFNENLSEEILLYNNEGDLKLGSFRLSQQGKSGTYLIKSIDDVDWGKSRITFFSYKRGSTEWVSISPQSIDKLTDEMKSLIYEADKKEEYVKCSFYIDDNKAKLIHIEPKFERVKEGGKIISYVDKFEY
jgi:hypothetical protein